MRSFLGKFGKLGNLSKPWSRGGSPEIISGVPPIMTNKHKLLSLKAFGGTEQSGTPTPDNPVDIVCNNGVLKVRYQSGLPLGYTLIEYLQNNRFWKETRISTPFAYNQVTKIVVNIKIVSSSSRNMFISSSSAGHVIPPYITLTGSSSEVNMTYFDYTNNVVTAEFLSTSRNLIEVSGWSDAVWTGIYNYGNIKFYNGAILLADYVPCRRNSDNVLGLFDIVSQTFLTNAGTGNFIAGNPINDPIESYADGIVENIQVHGKNLWTEDNFFGIGYYNNGNWVSDRNYRAYNIAVKPNTDYTMFQVGAFSWGGYVTFWNGDSYLTQVNIGNTNERHMTTPADCNKVTIVTAGLPIRTVQIEKGSTATAYEPYYNGGIANAEMLLKVGDYQDVQSILDGVVTRSVGIKVLDGSENISVLNLEKHIFLFFSISSNGLDEGKIVCTHFSNGTGKNLDNIGDGEISAFSAAVNGRFSIRMSSANTVEQIRQYLSDQYNAGTPVIVVYPLKTPITEQVAGQTLALTKGTNIIDITQASLDNLKLEVKAR